MRLVEIELPGSHVFTDQEQAWLKAAWVWGTEMKFNEDGHVAYSWNNYLVDADRMPCVPHVIKKVVASDRPLGLDVDTPSRPPVVNNRVNVMVPGLGLLLLDEVKLLADACTDYLNEHLKERWRIVAVCPQPDQRRPDYIVGRVKDSNPD